MARCKTRQRRPPRRRIQQAEEVIAKGMSSGKAKKLAQRCYGEGEHEKTQCPVARTVLNELKWIGNGVAAKEWPDDGGERAEAQKEQNGFGPFAGEEFVHAAIPA